jgi:hypothetical protein
MSIQPVDKGEKKYPWMGYYKFQDGVVTVLFFRKDDGVVISSEHSAWKVNDVHSIRGEHNFVASPVGTTVTFIQD